MEPYIHPPPPYIFMVWYLVKYRVWHGTYLNPGSIHMYRMDTQRGVHECWEAFAGYRLIVWEHLAVNSDKGRLSWTQHMGRCLCRYLTNNCYLQNFTNIIIKISNFLLFKYMSVQMTTVNFAQQYISWSLCYLNFNWCYIRDQIAWAFLCGNMTRITSSGNSCKLSLRKVTCCLCRLHLIPLVLSILQEFSQHSRVICVFHQHSRLQSLLPLQPLSKVQFLGCVTFVGNRVHIKNLAKLI
jgi:hypothetical protein